jgi:hypothetical protein
VSFFICQAHLPQDHVDRLQGTLQPCRRPQFFQGQIVLPRQQHPKLAPVAGHNHRLATGEAVPRGEVTGAPTLLQEFLDHAQRDAKTVGDLQAHTLIVIVGSQDSFPQVN